MFELKCLILFVILNQYLLISHVIGQNITKPTTQSTFTEIIYPPNNGTLRRIDYFPKEQQIKPPEINSEAETIFLPVSGNYYHPEKVLERIIVLPIKPAPVQPVPTQSAPTETTRFDFLNFDAYRVKPYDYSQTFKIEPKSEQVLWVNPQLKTYSENYVNVDDKDNGGGDYGKLSSYHLSSKGYPYQHSGNHVQGLHVDTSFYFDNIKRNEDDEDDKKSSSYITQDGVTHTYIHHDNTNPPQSANFEEYKINDNEPNSKVIQQNQGTESFIQHDNNNPTHSTDFDEFKVSDNPQSQKLILQTPVPVNYIRNDDDPQRSNYKIRYEYPAVTERISHNNPTSSVTTTSHNNKKVVSVKYDYVKPEEKTSEYTTHPVTPSQPQISTTLSTNFSLPIGLAYFEALRSNQNKPKYTKFVYEAADYFKTPSKYEETEPEPEYHAEKLVAAPPEDSQLNQYNYDDNYDSENYQESPVSEPLTGTTEGYEYNNNYEYVDQENPTQYSQIVYKSKSGAYSTDDGQDDESESEHESLPSLLDYYRPESSDKHSTTATGNGKHSTTENTETKQRHTYNIESNDTPRAEALVATTTTRKPRGSRGNVKFWHNIAVEDLEDAGLYRRRRDVTSQIPDMVAAESSGGEIHFFDLRGPKHPGYTAQNLYNQHSNGEELNENAGGQPQGPVAPPKRRQQPAQRQPVRPPPRRQANEYFQYVNVGNGIYNAGVGKGNKDHYIQQHERLIKPLGLFQKRVVWGDKKGGFGEHYYDLNHHNTGKDSKSQ